MLRVTWEWPRPWGIWSGPLLLVRSRRWGTAAGPRNGPGGADGSLQGGSRPRWSPRVRRPGGRWCCGGSARRAVYRRSFYRVLWNPGAAPGSHKTRLVLPGSCRSWVVRRVRPNPVRAAGPRGPGGAAESCGTRVVRRAEGGPGSCAGSARTRGGAAGRRARVVLRVPPEPGVVLPGLTGEPGVVRRATGARVVRRGSSESGRPGWCCRSPGRWRGRRGLPEGGPREVPSRGGGWGTARPRRDVWSAEWVEGEQFVGSATGGDGLGEQLTGDRAEGDTPHPVAAGGEDAR